jgi:hypothetical protein
MQIVSVGGFSTRNASTPRRNGTDRRQAELAQIESRALIAVEAAAPSERPAPASRYPAAAFLAHLIATHQQAPQTRARRRADLSEAVAAYAAMGPMRPVAVCSIAKTI